MLRLNPSSNRNNPCGILSQKKPLNPRVIAMPYRELVIVNSPGLRWYYCPG
jgi:hypothetical protein